MKSVKLVLCLVVLLLNFDSDTKTQALPIVLGHIAIANPVITLLGSATVALSVIAHNAYQSCQQKYTFYLQNTPGVPEEVIFAERHYYQERKAALQRIRNEFLAVKCGLEAIKDFQRMSSVSLMQHFLPKHSYDATQSKHDITQIQEKQLSEVQKTVIRKAREEELALLEQQIQNIQLVLALHVNHVIDAVTTSRKIYEDTIPESNKVVDEWNNNLQTMTKDIALRLYLYHLLHEHLLGRMRKAADELKLVSVYYRTCTSECIKKTTTIIDALDRMTPIIADTFKCIADEERRLRNNIAVSEKYFAEQHISVIKLKNEAQKAFDKKQKEYDAQVLKKVEEGLVCNSSAGGPKKPRNEDEFENMYEVFKRAPIGKILHESVEGTRFSYKGVSKIFRAIKDISEYGIKKGDWLYLDKMHGDHIEVFRKCGTTIRTVLNMNGTTNAAKLASAAGRDILRWIR